MILQALVKRYEDTADVKPGWERRNAQYALDISMSGELLGIIPLGKDNRGISLILPTTGSGRSGTRAYETAYFLCDDGGYMLGYEPRKFESAKNRHKEILEGIDSQAALAILAYFCKGIPSVPEDFDPKDKTTAKYIFQINTKRIDYDNIDTAIRDAWEKENSSAGDNRLCLVTGKYDTIKELHDKIGLRGVTMSKQPLISMNNQTSFRSYGSTPNDPPAQIGSAAAFASSTALNELLANKKNHQFISKDTLVFWSDGRAKGLEEQVFTWSINPHEDEEDHLSEIFPLVSKGLLPDFTEVSWDKPFYVLCLSPNAARISVRFFYVSTFGSIIGKITNHYENLNIHSTRPDSFKYLPFWILLSETTVTGSASDAPPLLGGQLLNSIITGARYPALLLNAICIRIKGGGDINRSKAAIIKAVLIRNFNESEVTTVSLNNDSNNKPYVLGRLFSVLEQLQRNAAGGSLNATIRDRYFASACANPGSVFPTLLKLSMHHASKAEYAIRYEKLKEDILGRLDSETPFPAALTLDDQGRFILGYYHQTQDFYTSNASKENRED
jgi:CRISPR-associated protein Csd1